MRRVLRFLSFLLLIVAFHACNNVRDFDFNPMVNFAAGDTVRLDMDLKNVVTQGIVIPSARQCDEGAFVFSFKAEKGRFYKIFYQNESYKFDDDDELSYENFYGSWEDVNVGFKKIESDVVFDSVRIVGNPRDERRYYGADITENPFSEAQIQQVCQRIDNNKSLHNMVLEKIAKNGLPYERQLRLDAIWIIRERSERGDFNNRWKRNPRVGCYSFMLVVCDEKALDTIPEYIKNIGKTDENGKFVNPYKYFAENKIEGVDVVVSERVLKTRAVITPEYGLYLDDSISGGSHQLYSEALYEQMFSDVSKQFTLRNIPLLQDVVSDENPYTRAQYEANKTRFDSAQLIYNHPVVSKVPGETVKIDNTDNSIVLINPGNADINNLKKESTGIKTRVGFTYGKFRGKIKFPVMLNDENIWNGLTYAFWLLYQNEHAWNNRRVSESGYISKNDDSRNPVRNPENFYSEIDIEIVKASKYWPVRYYDNKDEVENAIETARFNNEVAFCSTNWDLACKDPEHFMSGINKIPYNGTTFESMRWFETYKALTGKEPISNDVFKEDYYFYEIEWRPTEIIWRIGPSPDKMKVVGYMNDEYTSIPNNQMLCIVTQEYHYSDWWPPVLQWQGLIPYNKSDIKGKVFEIVVE